MQNLVIVIHVEGLSFFFWGGDAEVIVWNSVVLGQTLSADVEVVGEACQIF